MLGRHILATMNKLSYHNCNMGLYKMKIKYAILYESSPI